MGTWRSPESQGASGGMDKTRPDPAATGTDGLDQILGGGFRRNRIYLVRGSPGTGKTTLALQFLLHGIREREAALYIALSDSRIDLEDLGRVRGWSLDGLDIHEQNGGGRTYAETHQTIFPPAEIELTETMAALFEVINRAHYDRIVVDSVLELRLLAANALRYRRHILALRDHLRQRHATVLLLDELRPFDDSHVDALMHGVLFLGRKIDRSGASRRWLLVERMRATAFLEGDHNLTLAADGLRVEPRTASA